MLQRSSIGAVAIVAALGAALIGAQAHDESQFPDLKGQWVAEGANPNAPWDPSKPPGRGQQAPLTAEYQAVFEAALARQAEGVTIPTTCVPPGMPRTMLVHEPMEVIVMPDTTYVMLSFMSEFRRIYTDGRKWPEDIEAAYAGYSIGKWVDTDGDGRLDTLEVETRGMKGSRTFDASGIPLHQDNETVVKERIWLDKADQNLLHDEITTIDHALTRPWTVTRNYRRDRDASWNEFVCSEDNKHVMIGKEIYKIDDDGYLAPTRKGQPAPDLRYFPKRQ